MSVVEPLFLDTNVLVYAAWQAAPLHNEARAAIAAQRVAGVPLVISRQVIREFLATLNRPRSGITFATLLHEVQAFEAGMQVCDETATVTAELLRLLPQASGARVHDVNIVATMRVYGIPRLLTNNPADFAAFADRITIIPLI